MCRHLTGSTGAWARQRHHPSEGVGNEPRQGVDRSGRNDSRCVTGIRITHMGGPTVLISVDGWTVLTDPTFDPPGQKYNFGWGASSRKLAGPAIAPSDLPPIDAVLLTPRPPRRQPRSGRTRAASRSGRRHHDGGRRKAPRRRHPRTRALADNAARSSRAAIGRDHGHALPPRPTAQPPARGRRHRLRASLGRPGARCPVDLGGYRSLRRSTRRRRPAGNRHRDPAPRGRAIPVTGPSASP